ncbi:MAG: response regulator transcription factor [Anaerolineales bacterium]|nr:response regulator transcription factor [Anaerolineales bacterium]
MSQTILIVDDDRDIVRALAGYFEQAGFVTRTAYDGATALTIIRAEAITLVVLDLMLPDRDGWEITRTIRADRRLEQLPIIMLTARVGDSDKLLGLELGADDYITKPFNPHEVIARTRTVLRRVQPQASHIIQIGELIMDTDSRRVTLDSQFIDLTPTEYAILKTLMQNPNYVFSRSELITRSLGHEYESIERTLDSHIRNLRKKIEPDTSQPRYIQTVYGVGYKIEA